MIGRESILDTPNYTPQQMKSLRRIFHGLNPVMVFMWKIGLGRIVNMWPAVGGHIMVIRHKGRKTGKSYLTPVNFAVVDDHIYCAAGFGPATDWHRNMIASPEIELWLPDGKHRACAHEVSDSACRAKLVRAIAVAAGIPGRLFGIDPRKLNDAQLEEVGKNYRLVRFTLES